MSISINIENSRYYEVPEGENDNVRDSLSITIVLSLNNMVDAGYYDIFARGWVKVSTLKNLVIAMFLGEY